jgi:excisionase family DNA binding protein
MEIPKKLVTIKEAAEALGMSQRTIRNLVYRGFLHPNRVTRRLLFKVTEVDAFAAGQDTSQ